MNLRKLLVNILDFFNYQDNKHINKFLEEELNGITVSQLTYLDVLFRLENPTVTNIADELNITKSSVSELIKKLIGLGYIKKEKDEIDRRNSRILLTNKGKEVYQKYKKWEDSSYENAVKIIEDSLTEVELKILTELLKKINNNINNQ